MSGRAAAAATFGAEVCEGMVKRGVDDGGGSVTAVSKQANLNNLIAVVGTMVCGT